MEPIIAMDAHKHYSQFCVQSPTGTVLDECRVDHHKGAIAAFLAHWPQAEAVALETVGNYYWLVDEIEQAGKQPLLVHAHKAKLMLGSVNKTDRLDARGLNRLQRTGTLPTVWIPPGSVRDIRELPRLRMVLSRERTRLKNRVHSIFDKYGFQDHFSDLRDAFGREGRTRMAALGPQLPVHTRFAVRRLLQQIDAIQGQMARIERRMQKTFGETEVIRRLKTLPGVGFILAAVLACEIGQIERFGSAQRLASYAGTVPRVYSSGDRTRYGALRKDVNHYLKWAFLEAANQVAVHHKQRKHPHVCRLYQRLREKKGHAKAVGAVARHLAEACWWMYEKSEEYREPKNRAIFTTTA
jgi:transposase